MRARPVVLTLALAATLAMSARSDGQSQPAAKADAERHLNNWKAKPRELAQKLMPKYGMPDEVTAWGRYDEQTLDNDTLFDGLAFVSDELNGITTDNTGAPRPRHRREFPDGLWTMIEENGRSRVYPGVHWVFDAFAVDSNEEADLYRLKDQLPIGGVPLGLQIAEDIWDARKQKAPKKSAVGPRQTPCGPQAPKTETFSSSFLR